jgi:hypothetical protein
MKRSHILSLDDQHGSRRPSSTVAHSSPPQRQNKLCTSDHVVRGFHRGTITSPDALHYLNILRHTLFSGMTSNAVAASIDFQLNYGEWRLTEANRS